MKATELRIGNYINQIKYLNGHCDEIRKVASVNKEGFLNIEVLGQHIMKSHPIEWFEPIPLTEEILLKVGFELMNKWFDYELNGFRLGYITDDINFQFDAAKVIDIKHLHQPQNLYFALTGKELNTAGLI